MKEDGGDEYDIRKQEEVLAETVMMIPDTRSRLERGVEDLAEMLVRPKAHHSLISTRKPPRRICAPSCTPSG